MTKYKDMSPDQRVLQGCEILVWHLIKTMDPYEVAEFLRDMADKAQEYGDEEMTDEEVAARDKEDEQL